MLVCISLEAVKITGSRNYNNAYGKAIFSGLNNEESLHCHYEAIHCSHRDQGVTKANYRNSISSSHSRFMSEISSENEGLEVMKVDLLKKQ